MVERESTSHFQNSRKSKEIPTDYELNVDVQVAGHLETPTEPQTPTAFVPIGSSIGRIVGGHLYPRCLCLPSLAIIFHLLILTVSYIVTLFELVLQFANDKMDANVPMEPVLSLPDDL